jgi:hypothetical protein
MIARFDLTGIDEVKEAQPHFAHTPLAHLSYLKPDHVYAYWLDAIAEDLADECSVAFVSRNSERIDGLAVYTDSAWDTKTVGRRVALINHLAGVVDSTRGSEILRAAGDGLFDMQSSGSGLHGDSCAGVPWVSPYGHTAEFLIRLVAHAP